MKKLLLTLLCSGLLFGCSSNQVEENKQDKKPETQTTEVKKEEGIKCDNLVCELEDVKFTLGSSPVELIHALEKSGWYVDYASYIASGNDYDLEFANDQYDQFVKICFDLDMDQNEIKQVVNDEDWEALKGCKMYQIEVDLKDYQNDERLIDFKISKSGIHSTADEIVKDLNNYKIETNQREVEETPWTPAMNIVEGTYYYGENASDSLQFTYWINVDTNTCQGIRYSHFIY